MPFPPPPPPPPGPPPPPVPNFAPAAQAPASPEGRNLLLQSIRQGTTLKKTVTNDKSGPLIPGSGSGRPSSSSSTNTSSSGGSSSPRSNGSLNGSATLGRSNGLAGLFAGGMPKLKPTGVDIGQTNTSQSLTSLPSATGLGKQDQTRRQFNVDIKNRGPPPKPPPANQKPNMPQSTSDSVLTGPLHNRSNSTTSLNTNNSWSQMQTPQPIPKVAMKAPPGGYGKPNVAPKPPGIAAKSPGKLVNGRTSVTRAQSMRAPRSPPVAPPTGQMSLLPNQSDLYRGAPTFHQSQDSLLHAPPPPKHHTLPSPRAPPSRPPLRPPQTRPPPPPPNRLVMSPPCPPPPPPTQAPPPPPHRVPLPTHRIPPVPASLSPAPPPPPARHSSMRNGLPPSASFSSKLEARFAEKFHVKEEFPPPQTFLGVTKVYNSRTSKQPAPQPPPHVQLHWPQNNSSTC